MELTQIRIYQYNQLKWDEVTKNELVFDLAGPLTTLVGPNKSGKTTLLKVTQTFCNAVKSGTGEYSQQEAFELFGLDYTTSMDVHIVQGTFRVYYEEKMIQSEELTLSVIIMKRNSNNVYVHVLLEQVAVILQNINKLHEDKNQLLASFTRYFPPSIQRNQYGLFADLFPDVKVFNSRKVFDNSMRNLLMNDPVVRTKTDEISKEMQCLFSESCFDWNSIEPDEEFLKQFCTSLNQEEYDAHVGGHQRDKINMSLKVMSEGEHQCFQLLIHLCCAPRHSIILVDEPDAHLFSNAQKRLVHIIHRKLNEYHELRYFCQMVITTHSTDIMQQVQLNEIRQIFPTMKSKYAFEVKSLECTAQLLNIMESMGLAVLDHGEIIRLAVHRKLLLLENRNDHEFLRGIIRRANPNLLQIPLTVLEKGGPHNHTGGRFQPDDVKQFIKVFNQLLPNNSVLKIFILLDADLRSRHDSESALRKEEEAYKKLGNDYSNVKIYYHCWDAREWENWLLFDEDLLCNMLTGAEMGQLQAIKELRNKMMGKYEQHTNGYLQKPPTDKETFHTWFMNEIDRHARHLYSDKLTSSEFGVSTRKNDAVCDKREMGREYLKSKVIDPKKFGDDEEYVLSVLGGFVKSKQRENQQESQNKKFKSGDDKNWYKNAWLKDRKLPTLDELHPNASNDDTRKQLIKWIDAKDFFHELTEDSKYKCVGQVWKQALSSDTSIEDGFFDRYFKSLDPSDDRKWPEDFKKLLEIFTDFSQTP